MLFKRFIIIETLIKCTKIKQRLVLRKKKTNQMVENDKTTKIDNYLYVEIINVKFCCCDIVDG